MPLSVDPGVQAPPRDLLIRFYAQNLAVVRTAALLSRFVPVRVTSWWRSGERNRAAGGNPASQHLVGAAIDLVSPGLSRDQFLPLVAAAAGQYGAVVPQVASATSGRSVHVQAWPAGQLARLLRREPGLVI